MTLVIDAADSSGARLEAHLSKLLQVRRVEDVTHVTSVSRDLGMIKVAADTLTLPGICPGRARLAERIAPAGLDYCS
jgi:acetolactate synthase small subunit